MNLISVFKATGKSCSHNRRRKRNDKNLKQLSSLFQANETYFMVGIKLSIKIKCYYQTSTNRCKTVTDSPTGDPSVRDDVTECDVTAVLMSVKLLLVIGQHQCCLMFEQHTLINEQRQPQKTKVS
jgi:hypothetical protein